VLYLEEYSLPDQVRMFDRARVVAGHAGSGLFTLAFCSGPKDVILIRTTSYGARNEDLIAEARGHRVHLIWCEPDRKHRPGRWESSAYRSRFVVDLRRDGEFLSDLLRRL
jgi:capsular polysaccharide biosynthesis protein